MIRGLLFLAILINLGCQQKSATQRQARRAPQSPFEVGVAVTGFSEAQIQKLLNDNPNVEYRTLNPQHGLYELFNITRDEIPKQQGQTVADNRFVERTPSLSVPGWADCQFATPTPALRWDFAFPSMKPQGSTFLSPQILELNFGEDPQNQAAIQIAYPKYSGLDNRWIFQSQATEELSALGEYNILGAAQDQNHFCKTDSVRFILTSNDPWTHLELPPLGKDIPFSQLDMIDARATRLLFSGKGVTIAVIDTGSNYNDPSIQEQIALNPNEKFGNDFDNDQNGFKNDVIGYDFVNNDPFPFDDDGHGTHITGIIAAKEFGIAPLAKIIPIKAANSFGADFASVSAGIYYAVDRGAQIINLSFGGTQKDPTLEAALLYAKERGVLVVIAAGNGDPNTGLGFDLDIQPTYPASFHLENIMTVGAYDSINSLSPYSNFGKSTVDLVAPGGFYGDLIESLAYKNPLHRRTMGMMGTSMAAPMVTAVAAQLWAQNPNLSAFEIRHVLMSSVVPVEDLKNITVSGGKLNSRAALEKLKF